MSMQPLNRQEAIQSLLEGMLATGQSFQWVKNVEHAGITPHFPGGNFTVVLDNLKNLTAETADGYNELIGILGSIPVRLGFGTDEETPAEIIELTNFEDGRWHYKYKIEGKIADIQHSSTSESLMQAFWASIIPAPEDLKSE